MKLLFPALALGLMLPAMSALAAGNGGAGHGEERRAGRCQGHDALHLRQGQRSGKSMCNGGCAQNWPPLMAAADDSAMGDWTLIKRDDGSAQWAY